MSACLFIAGGLDYNTGLRGPRHRPRCHRRPPNTPQIPGMSMLSIHARLAQELVAKESQVAAAVALLDEGATVPFLARYRKEATSGLVDTLLRLLDLRLRYLRYLDELREVVRKSIELLGNLTSELAPHFQ